MGSLGSVSTLHVAVENMYRFNTNSADPYGNSASLDFG